jgi:hypothetical protein
VSKKYLKQQKHLLQANMSTIMISEIMERHIKSICSEYGTYIVNKLSAKYGFDAEAEIRELELPSIKIAEAAPRRKDVTEKKPKAAKVEKAPVPSIPLPFCGKAVEGWCSAIVKNNKLYTQCTNTAAGLLCKKCTKISEKEGSLPFGIISSRLECEPMSYKDPKGNAPVLYSAVMAKLNITREEAEAEAAKFGLTIPEEQFAVVEKTRGRPKKEVAAEKSDDEKGEKKARGRPKKDKPVKASSKAGDDIIAGLLMEAKDNETEDDAAASDSQSSNEAELVSGAKAVVEKVMKEVADKKQAKEKKPKQTEEDKAAAKAAKAAAKEAEKAAAKEAEKAAKAAAKEAEKAAKEAEKAAKEAEKAAAKAAKDAEKAAKAKVEKPKAAKAVSEKPKAVAAAAAATSESDDEEVGAAAAPPAVAAKPLKGGVAESKGDDDASSSSCEEESYDEESEEEEAVTVKKFEHAGKKYKISTKDNILYDWDDDEPVGVWNPKTKTIDELPEEDSEEEDDE